LVFYIGMTALSSNVLTDTISSLGLMIAFYYGLTGLACVWWFRRDLTNSGRDLLVKGIMPGLGGLILFFFFFYGAKQFWSASYGSTFWTMPFSPHWQIGGVFLTGAGALVLGLVLMYIYRYVSPPFFKGEILNKDSEILVPDN